MLAAMLRTSRAGLASRLASAPACGAAAAPRARRSIAAAAAAAADDEPDRVAVVQGASRGAF